MNHPLDITYAQGLSSKDAREKLKLEGYNEIVTQEHHGSAETLLRILSEPMLLLLLISGGLYLAIGEAKDALVLLFAVIVVIAITYYQERKTEKTLQALKNLSSPRALVIRDGVQRRIPGREVVRGDLLIIREGDRVPADAVVISSENLSIDESLLTGESVPVRKNEWDGKMEKQRPGGDDLPFIYSGTLVVDGRGIAKVMAVGVRTEMGRIGKSLASIKEEKTLLHKETGKIVKLMATVGIGLCLLVSTAYIIVRGEVVPGILAGLTLSMSLLPEEFPVVLLIFLTLGAWRISKRNVLTRRSAAIETLGAATVLCTDKTGTLTKNKMELMALFTNENYLEPLKNSKEKLEEEYHELLEYGILASQRDPFDPIEKELWEAGEKYLTHTRHLHNNWEIVKEYPLTRTLLSMSHVWQSPSKDELVIAAKGAPEAIMKLCQFDSKKRKKLLERVEQMSSRGLRVIAVAKSIFRKVNLPNKQTEFKFKFVGLLGFTDPIRPTAPGAVEEAYEAGMRIIVVTGDYPGTAQYVARRIGIKNYENYMTGEELAKIDNTELKKRIRDINVFARVVPEQKLLIVNALKANGEIVAMTGDGVNDAPALKAAHIGVAMGERGTDVAREASALVLLDDDFSSIVVAVRLGRRIYANIKRAMGYILSVHVPIAGMSLLPILFDLPPVLYPAHIAFLELIIDPSCTVVFESIRADRELMKNPPRDITEPLFDKRTVKVSLGQGLTVLISTFGIYAVALYMGRDEAIARSLAFTTLVVSNLLLVVVNLSWNSSTLGALVTMGRTIYLVFAIAIIMLGASLYVPYVSELFHLSPLSLQDLGITLLLSLLSLVWFELWKYFRKGEGLN